MKIESFSPELEAEDDDKLQKACLKFEALLLELRKRDLNEDLINSINKEVEFLNTVSGSKKALRKEIKKKLLIIVRMAEKGANLVTKNHYRNVWLAIGMSVFGLPIGLVFGIALNNMAYLGIGLPIGMAIGIAVGTKIDLKVKAEGRQLDFELG